MLVKIHKNIDGKVIAAICDEALIGKRIEEGDMQLDLSSDFYNGEERPMSEIADIMRNAYIVNLVGEKSISLGLKEEVISRENIRNIKGVPFAQAIVPQE
jgi:hypothetical protein